MLLDHCALLLVGHRVATQVLRLRVGVGVAVDHGAAQPRLTLASFIEFTDESGEEAVFVLYLRIIDNGGDKFFLIL